MESAAILTFGGIVLGWTIERLQSHYRQVWAERRRRARLHHLFHRDE